MKLCPLNDKGEWEGQMTLLQLGVRTMKSKEKGDKRGKRKSWDNRENDWGYEKKISRIMVMKEKGKAQIWEAEGGNRKRGLVKVGE